MHGDYFKMLFYLCFNHCGYIQQLHVQPPHQTTNIMSKFNTLTNSRQALLHFPRVNANLIIAS